MVLISIVSSYLSSSKLHSVHPSSFSAGGGGVWFEPSTKFSKRKDLTGSQKVVAGKDRGELFQGWGGGWGGFSFYIKNKLKYEIFNVKKGL